MSNTIAEFFLFFSDGLFISCFIFVGLLFINRTAFINTLILLLFSTVLNAYLKYYFQIPLNPALGKVGWAYPSGHTVSNVVLWGAVAIQLRKPWVFLCGALVLTSCFIAMVYREYHTWPDILGGVCTAGLLLVGFYYWVRYYQHKSLAFASVLLLLSVVIYFNLPHHITGVNYAWVRYCIGIHTAIISVLIIGLKLKRRRELLP